MNKQNDSWSLRINIRSSGQEKGSGSILSKLNIALSVVLWLGWAKKIQLTRGVSVSTEVTGKILSTMRILLVPHKNPEYQVVIWINIDSRRTACGWHFHSVSKWTTQSCRQIFRVSHWIESLQLELFHENNKLKPKVKVNFNVSFINDLITMSLVGFTYCWCFQSESRGNVSLHWIKLSLSDRKFDYFLSELAVNKSRSLTSMWNIKAIFLTNEHGQ